MTATYTIRLDPRGKGRPIFSRRSGRARTPDTTRAWESLAVAQIREQHGEHRALDDYAPLWAVYIHAYHPRPKARPAYVPRALWAMDGHEVHATSRHDLDNVVKIVLDAFQSAGVLANDRCIVTICADSWLSQTREGRIEVEFSEVAQ